MCLPAIDYLHIGYWLKHPFGMPLVVKCIEKFRAEGGVVGELVLSLHCLIVLTQFAERRPIRKTRTDLQWTLLNSREAEEKQRVPYKEGIILTIKQFTEFLLKWGMNGKANSLMKSLFLLEDTTLLPASCYTINTEVNHTFASHQALYCRSCDKHLLICSICEKVVAGLGVYCEVCHHGGHLMHQKMWFSMEQRCAKGCGCLCLSSFSK